jgi:serine/threonine protein kinase
VTGIDIGMMRPPLTTTQQVMILVLEVFLMVITMMIARMSRRAALVAVSELEQATRLAAHRQALLIEAREELERALRPKRGRFSDQAIGSYQLGDVLGRGAMGEVYAAVDGRSGGEVAIKLLSQASLGNPNHVLRFFRELRTAAKVESPHVVRVIEIGEEPVPFLVMERLEGRTLSEILRERRTLKPAEVVELVEHVGIGVTAASAAGIVHRDLKPQNVFRHHEVWKVLDFGIARAIDHGETLTAGQVVGTPSYMSPEQASGEQVDHRTDLYALAAIAYRALTGHQPFASTDLAEILYRVVHTRPIRPTLLAPDLPVDVDLVIAIGMARRPGDRFANAAELADALRHALAGTLAAGVRARGQAIVHAVGWSTNLKR